MRYALVGRFDDDPGDRRIGSVPEDGMGWSMRARAANTAISNSNQRQIMV